MANDLEKKITQQLEYYFGDINLPRDKFLKEKIQEDEGWVTLEVLLTFNRLAKLSTDHEVIANALGNSELLEVSEDKKKIRRKTDKPVPEMNESLRKELMTKTAYTKGFPTDETLENIITFLEEYGPPESCIYRKTPDNKFKGSCFIIFKDIEACKKFIELESVKYKETELTRKWQADYVANKKKEIEERKKAKKEKKESKTEEEKVEKTIEFPKGAVIFFTGLSAENTVTREEIKEAVKKVATEEIRYIDFNKGELEGYIRFSKENEAHDFLKNVTDSELTVGEFKLKIKALEGEEEEAFLKKTSDSVLKMRQKQKEGGNRKRKGNFRHNSGGKQKRNK